MNNTLIIKKGEGLLNNKRYMKAVLVFVIFLFINMKFPYSDKSILSLIVPPITKGSSTFFPGGFVTLGVLLWVFYEIKESKQFKIGPFLLFIIYIALVVPFSLKAIDSVKMPIYYLNNGVGSIEIKDSNLMHTQIDGEDYIVVTMDLKGHRNLYDDVSVEVKLNDELLANITTLGMSKNLINGLGKNEIRSLRFEYPVDFLEDDFDSAYYHLFNSSAYYISFIQEEKVQVHWRNDCY